MKTDKTDAATPIAAAAAAEEAKVKGVPTRDFNDAGTERHFTAGEEAEFTPGELANYAAAGLVTPAA